MSPAVYSTKGLGHSFGSLEVLRGLDFRIKAGEILGIAGPNGSGKSTLLSLLSGYLKPSLGELSFRGAPLGNLTDKDRARQISHVSQNFSSTFPFTVRELVEMGRYPHATTGLFGRSPDDEGSISRAMDMAGITHLADREITRISGGELQRVFIAKAFATEPRVLLLDEPTASLDMKYQTTIMEKARDFTREKNRTAVAVLHDLNLASSYCDRILLLNKGEIAALGSPKDVLNYDLLKKVFDTEMYIGVLDHIERPFVIPISKVETHMLS